MMAHPATVLADQLFQLFEAEAWEDVSLFDATPLPDEGEHDRRLWMGGYTINNAYHSVLQQPTVDSGIHVRVNCDVVHESSAKQALDNCTELAQRVHTVLRKAIGDRHEWQVGRRVRPAVSAEEHEEPDQLRDRAGWVATCVLFVNFDINTNPPS